MKAAGLRAISVGIALGAVLLATACKRPALGDPCRESGAGHCVDANHALTCRSYSWHLDSCLGAGACSESGGKVTCDQSVAEDGASCATRGALSCAKDGPALLRCDGAKEKRVSSCRGPDGCQPGENGAAPACDIRNAREGDPCIVSDYGAYTCDVAGTAKLSCVDGVYVHYEACRGPSRCTATGTSDADVTCDDAIGAEGEACHTIADACSPDRKSLLHCSDVRNGHWVVSSRCGGEGGCTPHEIPGRKPGPYGILIPSVPLHPQKMCDQSISEIGAPCTHYGSQEACSTDGTTLLSCEQIGGGHGHDSCAIRPSAMTAQKKCARGCATSGTPHCR